MSTRPHPRRLALVAGALVVAVLLAGGACAPVIARILIAVGAEVAVEAGATFVRELLDPDESLASPVVTIAYTGADGNGATVSYEVNGISTISVKELEGTVEISGSTCVWTIVVAAGTNARVEISGEEGESISCPGQAPPPQPEPSSLRTPELVASFTLDSGDVDGEQFTASQTGVHRFTYVDGAYAQGPLCCFPPGRYPWLTGFVIFDGSQPDFSGVPDDGSGRPFPNRSTALRWAVDNGYMPTVDAANAAALEAPSVDVRLSAGQTVTVVCIEARDYFYDNVGSMDIDILYVRP